MRGSAKVLAVAELRRLLAHARGSRTATRNQIIVLLSFRAGLRACEIAGLDWPSVLRPDGRIASMVTVSGNIAKNGRGRVIPMHPELRRSLDALHAEAERPTSGPVVQSLRGSHMTPRSVVNWFAAAYAELGLDGCSSHSGRRTFITRAARLISKAGGSLRDVQELAGHRALTTTERYIEGDREAQRKLIRLL
jgi:integrase/recombinase XerD